MPLTTEGQNVAADAVAGVAGFLALFDGDPSGGGSELTGGSPAYARKPITWGAAAGGVATITGLPVTFDVPSGATVDHFAVYSAVSGGTQYGHEALSAAEGPYAAQGTYDFTSGSLTIT